MRKITLLSVFVLTIGWFPFMWIAVFSSNHKEYVMYALFLGLFLCIPSAIIVASSLSNKALWINQEKLDAEIQSFKEVKKAYEQATKAFVSQFLDKKSNN